MIQTPVPHVLYDARASYTPHTDMIWIFAIPRLPMPVGLYKNRPKTHLGGLRIFCLSRIVAHTCAIWQVSSFALVGETPHDMLIHYMHSKGRHG